VAARQSPEPDDGDNATRQQELAGRSVQRAAVSLGDPNPRLGFLSSSQPPIHGEDGKIRGIFCPVIETTEKIIVERRLRTLRDLAARCKGLDSEAAVYHGAAEILRLNPCDVPFALVYPIDEGEAFATLEAAVGIEPGERASPVHVELRTGAPATWALDTVARSRASLTPTDISVHSDALPMGAWKVAPHTAMIPPCCGLARNTPARWWRLA
jgi:hypothetical protein